MERSTVQAVYGEAELDRIRSLTNLLAPPMTRESLAQDPDLLARTDVLLSGWGGPSLDEPMLSRAPRLQAVFYAAGAMGNVLSPAVWERGLTISSALSMNAIPVAEFTLATILLSLKHVWRLVCEVRTQRTFTDRDRGPGAYGSKVGIISLGAVGMKVIELLEPFDLNVFVYDPFLTDERAATLGVTRATLDEIFGECDVVSLHAPALPETHRMITGAHFAAMKPYATFLNTARPTVVRQDEMIEVATRRTDLQFILDVVEPEPPEPDSPLYDLPNVLLTPHVAGSVGAERQRLGRFAVDELERYLASQPLKGQVTAGTAHNSSHRPIDISAKAVTTLDRSTLVAATVGRNAVRHADIEPAAAAASVPVDS